MGWVCIGLALIICTLIGAGVVLTKGGANFIIALAPYITVVVIIGVIGKLFSKKSKNEDEKK